MGALEFIHVMNYGHRDWEPQDLLLDPSPLYYQTYRPSGSLFAAGADSIVPVVGIASFPMLKAADVGFPRWLMSSASVLLGIKF